MANADVKTASTINEIAKGFTLRQGKNAQPELHLNVRQLKDALRLDDSKAASEEFVERIHHQCFENASPQKGQKPGSLAFAIDSNYFTADTLSATTGEPITEPKQKIVIEFSSPNIAKPFHMGHLRSTIIGNALSNLYQAFGHDVTRINYLGDWGTQFGMLKIGMDAAALSEAEIKANPIKHLFEAYVAANKLAESDPNVRERARQVFCSLENGDQGDLAEWAAYREYTVAELSAVYDRLGIRFDEYAWESQYSKQKISDCLALMKEKDLLQQDDEGKTYVEIGDAQVTLLKSDGSTMYLTRDVAAIMDRQRRLKYDKMLYVVDNGQSTHFTQLFEIAKRLGVANVDGLQHVKFGRINKMSTRKGNVVFLKDILDEARNISMEYQLNEPCEFLHTFCLPPDRWLQSIDIRYLSYKFTSHCQLQKSTPNWLNRTRAKWLAAHRSLSMIFDANEWPITILIGTARCRCANTHTH